ncbi:MAG: DNA mismatch repair protein MutS [Oscillospiraceae bacterium]|jgi:DNA mismatch repair protein MutS|nr:DNA mismatch repair protein MutS [Oscillospiraceae bacterium]
MQSHETLTPMMRQYWEIKEQYQDAILMYRLGDFYEMFFDDACLASKELELALTGRDCGQEERAPMCGVPFHSADGYIARLVAKGHKVAICEQTEDPALAKGLVRREVIRVMTPGTVIENGMLDESRNNYLACVFLSGDEAGLCFLDGSTGTAETTVVKQPHLLPKINNELAKYYPSELLLNQSASEHKQLRDFFEKRLRASIEMLSDDQFAFLDCKQVCLAHFSAESLQSQGILDDTSAVCSFGAALRYLAQMQKSPRSSVRYFEFYGEKQYLQLDASSRRNLELCETMRTRETKGTLLWVLDKTSSAMGKRCLRNWLERPLYHLPRITKRQCAVAELLEQSDMRFLLRDALRTLHDVERMMARVVYQTANARELVAIAQSMAVFPQIKSALLPAQSDMLRQIYTEIDTCEDLCAMLTDALDPAPPFSTRDGGMILDGYCLELDELRRMERDGKGYLADVQAKEQEATGIKKLKIGFNRVFGYFLEVPNAFKEVVPAHYVRKQTLSNCERYITDELKTLESKVLGAAERAVKLEYEIFTQLRGALSDAYNRVQRTAAALASLDVLCCLAHVAGANDYCRPEVTIDGCVDITDGRHPVLEKIAEQQFVPNNTYLGGKDALCAVITGPNMAGKSTYMRQVALITLMAQIGSFVPAKTATIGMVDAIFTRVGASDDITTGQSTFMVEMAEVAHILQNATQNSLIIFDEIGRGTSTFDGMSIARAVLEYAVNPKTLGAKTLFATHYHELTEMEDMLPGVQNFSISIKKRGDDITFLRRVVRGCADGSFGIEVAKLAGVPNEVLRRAKVVLQSLQLADTREHRAAGGTVPEETAKDDPFSQGKEELLRDLARMNPNTITPLEALTVLHGLIQRAKEWEG